MKSQSKNFSKLPFHEKLELGLNFINLSTDSCSLHHIIRQYAFYS